MSTELVAQSIGSAALAIAKTEGRNYSVKSPLTGIEAKLKRGIDFGLIPHTGKPVLLKPGCEKVAMAYGLMQRYSIESKVENFDGKNLLCYYLVKCELVKGFMQPDGTYHEVVYSSAYGSANTSEKRNGMNDAYNAANSTVKMAEKRALSSAVMAISGLSGMFDQDIENEAFMKKSEEILKETPESPLRKGQVDRIFGIFLGEKALSTNEAKMILKSWGFASTKDIKQKDYDSVIEKINKLEVKNNAVDA